MKTESYHSYTLMLRWNNGFCKTLNVVAISKEAARKETVKTKATSRFTAYYKIEQYDERRCVWRPIQRAFATYAEADKSRPSGKTRVMHFDGKTFTEATA